MTARLRPLVPDDHAEVLALNDRNVELTAPLDEPRLAALVGWADRALVLDVDGRFAGFVLTYASGSAYDGENFGWFSERYDDLAYLDRVVVHEDFRRRGLATLLYDDVEARCGRPVMALEVNLDPPNEPSLAFHRARGYTEVGQRESGGHLVSMLVKRLAPDLPLEP